MTDAEVSAVDFARYLTAFNRYESCSKCVPCARGNPALVEIIDRIRLGRGTKADLPLIRRTSKHVIELSLCGLGQVAPMPLLGMMDQYPEEFETAVTNNTGTVLWLTQRQERVLATEITTTPAAD